MTKPYWDAWYRTSRWQKLRAAYLNANPLCAMCLPRCVRATVCDHIEPHKGSETKFWSGPFQGLCAPHHNSLKQSIEKGGKRQRIGDDGWLIE